MSAARERGIPSAELAAEMTRAYIADTDRLGIGRPDREPLASETIAEIVALIEELVAGGHAYEAGGDVYFAVRSFPAYGDLSGQRPDELRAGARVEPGEHKRDPVDFALWKAVKPGQDEAWESPWGRGRPGWHIECSAMAERFLGREFELHGGGRDLIFPHHENEVAQSCSAGRPFARVWAHNGMLRLSGEKMSKSLGNIDRLHDALDDWGAETFLMFLLQAHYASPVDYNDEALERARAACETLRNRLRSGSGVDAGLRVAVCRRAGRRLQHARGAGPAVRRAAGARDTVAEVLDVLGLGRSRTMRRPRPTWSRWRRSGRRRATGATSPSPTACVTRSPVAAGRCVTAPRGSSSTRAVSDVVYGRRAVREALRGRREVGQVWCAARSAGDARLAAEGRS